MFVSCIFVEIIEKNCQPSVQTHELNLIPGVSVEAGDWQFLPTIEIQMT